MARVLIIGSLEAELGQAARIAVARGARLTVAEGAAAGLAMIGLIFLSLISYCIYEYRSGRRILNREEALLN